VVFDGHMFRAGGVQAVLFDTFGTVVDWRSGIAAAVAEAAGAHSMAVDSAAARVEGHAAETKKIVSPDRSRLRYPGPGCT
jgi:FMN phosphatase YigB (HAD superfamily)